ncbi:MAG TPA: bifunctional riboflavin kinase/FAD synthetase [Firmicutes bacterium]|jgi:riboflavin kinase/FMN adenylyltransferase|nr:bifunctional riboflavin kinase/FAD synthetase [Bacillota bacterium]
MRIYSDVNELTTAARYVGVGSFDGVHCGHQKIIAYLVARARAEGGRALVITFNPHPMMFFQTVPKRYLLTTTAAKAEFLAALGVDELLVIPFTRQFADMPASQFAERVLGRGCQAREVAVGYNFRFGRQGEGDGEALVMFGEKYGFQTKIFAPIRINDEVVSSTRIRQYLGEGEIAAAARLLGRPYAVQGVVEKGDARGRELGFPTANLRTPPEQLLPLAGVYALRVYLNGDDQPRPAVGNLGRRPTFGGGDERLEVHLLTGGEELYGRILRVEFFRRLRSERPFPDRRALQEQIRADVAQARRLLVPCD